MDADYERQAAELGLLDRRPDDLGRMMQTLTDRAVAAATADVLALRAELERLSRDGVVVLPDGTEVRLLDARGSE